MSSALMPQPLLDAAVVRSAVEGALDDLAQQVLADFEKTVATWGAPPTFAITKRPSIREIATGGRIYTMLNKGTSPHIIRAQKARRLAFQVPFKAKTTPRQIGSGSGSRGGTPVFAQEVRHPGTEPREWDQVIAEKYQGIIVEAVQQVINGAVKR